VTGPSALTVLSCHAEARDDDGLAELLEGIPGLPVHRVGRRPGKTIDPLLAGRLLVLGDDGDLNAVVLRLLRRNLLGAVEVAYAPKSRTTFTDLWNLPHGRRAVAVARSDRAPPVPLVRDDVGGVLLARAELSPVDGIAYVDAACVLRGVADRITVAPDRAKGLAVTLTQRRLGGLGRRSTTTLGRAVQIGSTPTTVVSDGTAYPRAMDRWTFYLHTAPLLLVGAG
jgi:hypothetical protein